MTKTILLAASILVSAALPAAAQHVNVDSQSASQALSSSGIFTEGDNVSSRNYNASVSVGNNTASCIQTAGIGLFGVALSGSTTARFCRDQERHTLLQKINKTHGTERVVAIRFWAQRDRVMADMMEGLGWLIPSDR